MGQGMKAQRACLSMHPLVHSFILQMISDCQVLCKGLGRLCRGKRGRVPALMKFIFAISTVLFLFRGGNCKREEAAKGHTEG